MAGGTILLALVAAATQTATTRADNVRVAASASVTIIAGDQVRFAMVPHSRSEKRLAKAQRRTDAGQVLIEFY
jgi:hypothetical protein